MERLYSGPLWAVTGLLVVLFGTAGWLYKDWLLAYAPTPDPEPEISSGQLVTRTIKTPQIPLELEQREYIWKVETKVLVVNGFWFKDLTQALAKGDEKKIDSFLADNFTGQFLDKAAETTVHNEFAQVVRLTDSGARPRSLDRSQFLAQLMEYRKLFAKEPKVVIKAKNLGPVVRENFGGLWQGTALFRMYGEADHGQPAEVLLQLNYVIAEPIKEHNQKGWMVSCGITMSQVGKAKDFLLKDVTVERGIDPNRYHDNWKTSDKQPGTGGVFLSDFNRDGIPDILISDYKALTLYQGLPGGKLADVTASMGLPHDPLSLPSPEMVCAWIDVDGDGWEDLILMGRVYRNEYGKKFVDYTSKCNLRYLPTCMNIAVADFDRDGKVDLYVSAQGSAKADRSWLDGHSGSPHENQLWRNLGNWSFENVTAQSGTGGGFRSTFSAVWFDANNDGWPDLHVPNEFGDGVLLVNQGNGKFKGQLLAEGNSDFGTMGLATGDVNNDGHIDVFTANMFSKAGTRIIANLKPGTYSDAIMARFGRLVAGNQLHLNRGGLKFEALGKQLAVHDVGWAFGPNLIDLDNDGWLDIYATTGFISINRHEPDG